MENQRYIKHTWLALLFVAIVISSCDKYLDIKPEDTLVETDVFKEEALAERALGEAYLTFAQSISGPVYLFGDYTTEIVQSQDVEYYGKFIDGFVEPEDAAVSGFWLNHYSVINLANSLIVKIPEFGQYDEEVEQQHIAEAKFLRAFAYFKLLTLFGDGALTGKIGGLGLPLQLTPFKGYNFKDPHLSRSTVQQTYDQIIEDLIESMAVLPESYSNDLDTRTRATKGATMALLSRVYLYMQEYALAAEYAQKVLDLSSVFIFEPDLLVLFPDNSKRNLTAFSKEYIYGLPYALDKMGSNNISYYFKLSHWVDESFAATYEAGDLRYEKLIYTGDTEYNQHLTANRRSTFKFTEPYGRTHVPMIRLTEIMLTKAEALARTTGINQESVDILNQIRNRAFENYLDMTMGDFASVDVLINKILDERKYELAFEGFHRFDLIRTGRSLRNAELSEDLMVLPIPQTEIELSNNSIQQNPGYLN